MNRIIRFMVIITSLLIAIFYLDYISENRLISQIPEQMIFIKNQLFNIFIVVLLAYGLSVAYYKLNSFSIDRLKMYQSFVPIALITYLLISTITLSLSLSLGMVGALSLIRFRTAIKDVTDIAYLFCCFAIGIAVGAGSRGVIALVVIYPFALLSFYLYSKSRKIQTIYLIEIQSQKQGEEYVLQMDKKLISLYASDHIVFNLTDSGLQSVHKIITDSPDIINSIKNLIAEFSGKNLSINLTKSSE